MKIFTFRKTIWLLFYILIFAYLIHNSYNYLDPDLGWHLRVGQEISLNQAVPSFDLYNFSLEGKKWVDHEWLLNLISFSIYDNLGYFALSSFFASLVIASLLIAVFSLKKYYFNLKQNQTLSNRQTVLIMFFQLVGTMAMSPHLGIRMQESSLLFLVLLLTIFSSYSAKKDYRILFSLLPLFYFWSCLHAGFLIGLFLLFFFICTKVLENLVVRFNLINSMEFKNRYSYKEISILLIFGIFSIVSTLLTPYGVGLYSFLSEYSNTFYMGLIAEWLPFYYLPIQYKQVVYLAIMTSALLLFIFNILSLRKKNNNKIEIDLWLFLTSLLFIVLSFKSKRHFPLFFFISFPLLISLADTFLTYPANFFKNIKNSKIIKFYLIAGLTISTINLFITTDFCSDPFDKKRYCDIFPCGAVNFLNNNQQYNSSKIFNAYDWGGYLIWAYPANKIFIDGRLPQYKFAGHTLLEEYLEFFEENKSAEKLEQHDIDLVLYKKQNTPEVNKFEKIILAVENKEEPKYYLRLYLENNSQWKLVYEDKICQIYAKN